jgi:hypothetical protein
MNPVSDIARRSDGWGWFFVCALFGISWAPGLSVARAAIAYPDGSAGCSFGAGDRRRVARLSAC